MENDPAPVALPAGLEEFPDLGAGVVGTTVAEAARWLIWTKAIAWLLAAGAALWLGAGAVGAAAGPLVGLTLAGSCAFMAFGDLALVRLGERPALTVDAESVHCHVPGNRASVRLDAITRVDRVRRDLLIEARGGISRSGRPSRARWLGISGVHTFAVARPDLVAYLRERAEQARAPH